MKSKQSKQQIELDKALISLTDTIQKIRNNLNTYVGDSSSDLFNKMSEARQSVDEIAEESRKIFRECLERCLESEFSDPSVKWSRDEHGNLTRNQFSRVRPPCEICGESRKVEFCHIIPRQLGGSDKETNILYLCPSHHSCFDNGLLSKNEWGAIDWRGKSDLTKSYVIEVLKKRQEDHWSGKRVDSNMAYMSYPPLTEWIKNKLGCESVDTWNRKRNNILFKRSGKARLG